MPLLADGLHNPRHALRSWAVLIHWLPTASSMSSLHLLLGLPLSRFPSLGVHSDVIFAHLVFFILATCPAHCPFMHFTFSIISITPVFDLIISFLIMCNEVARRRPRTVHVTCSYYHSGHNKLYHVPYNIITWVEFNTLLYMFWQKYVPHT